MKARGGEVRVNARTVVTRAVKYTVQIAAVFAVAFFTPQHKLRVQEAFIIALTSAAVFSLLDLFAPSVVTPPPCSFRGL